MSAKDYELLKKKSAAARLSANAWLMAQLETNRPVLHREEETWEAIRFMDEAGRRSTPSPAISTAVMAQRSSSATLFIFWALCTNGSMR